MYDFEVFPAIITKTRLYQIFCECYEQSIDKIVQNKNLKITDLFLKEKEKYNTSGKKRIFQQVHKRDSSQDHHQRPSPPQVIKTYAHQHIPPNDAQDQQLDLRINS